MTGDFDYDACVAPYASGHEAIQALLFGMCWPNDSAFSDHVDIILNAGESLREATRRLELAWSPAWLLDAGFSALDYGAVGLGFDSVATQTGPVSWNPTARLCRVDDQVKDDTVRENRLAGTRRIAGEVAILALWTAAATRLAADPRPPVDISGNTRGARFKNLLVAFIQNQIEPSWSVEPEVALGHIRGLHMRRDVGNRRSDIVVLDEGRRLLAVISSKWTWRSDRGTEAAQMVPLTKYRPDVPYVVVTAEFPRAATVGRESIEDRAYHLSPEWVGAWHATQRLDDVRPAEAWPGLLDLQREGRRVAETLGLAGLHDLIGDLRAAGDIV